MFKGILVFMWSFVALLPKPGERRMPFRELMFNPNPAKRIASSTLYLLSSTM